MTGATNQIILLTLASFGLLVALTLFGEYLRSRVPPGKSDPVVETYMTRIYSWWTMVIFFALALLTGLFGVVLLFTFSAFAALREFYTFSYKSQADHLALALAFFLILPLQFAFVWSGWAELFTVFIPVYAFLMLPMVSVLRGDPNRFLNRVSETQWGLMICVYCISHVPALMTLDLPGFEGRGVLLIAFLVMVVQIGDLLDIYFGRRIGRTRIAPGLSPKTWEGLVCGVVAAAVTGAMLYWMTPFSPLAAMAMAAVASVTGMFGNLVLTAIKRDKGVRDWSHLIPGQGGLLDQLDSVIFAAPIFYHLTHLIWAK
ncbi:MAG: phosphatidate cytidylyltransferase [Rhodobacterales bacterium]|nr:phosphatidate cytidylyltransferase [Rhodobacterales bacterium]